MIQIHRLEGFYHVARTGGYARAARAFPYPITQPAVHQQVKKLEAELGLDLFERVAKDRVQPTPAGRKLYEFVAPFFEGLPATLRSIESGDYGGEIVIHAQGIALRRMLPAWIKRVRRKRPHSRIQLGEMTTFDVAALRSGEADGLVAFLPDVPDDIASMRVATMYPFLVLPRGHALADRKRIKIEDLDAECFVGFHAGTLARDLQDKVLGDHGVRPRRVIEVGAVDAILGFVEAGLGYSLVPALDRRGPRLRGIVARPAPARGNEYPVHLVWRRDAPENPMLDALIETAPSP